MALEPSLEKQLKYLDFIDIYANLDDNERQRYTQLYPQEVAMMTGFAQRFREEGRQGDREHPARPQHRPDERTDADLRQARHQYSNRVDVYDPWVDRDEAQHE